VQEAVKSENVLMRFRSYIPRAPLSELVEDFWLYEDYVGDHVRETILPSGTFELVFNLREDELRIYGPSDPAQCRSFRGAIISGPYAGSFMSDAAEEREILGVHFRPSGAFPMFGLPASDFTNRHVELRAVWGPAATTLRDRLCAAREPMERFALVEQALLARLSHSRRRHPAVRAGLDMLVGARGGATVRDIAEAVDLSRRRFIDVFATEVGMTPKVFGRVQRFQLAVASSRVPAKPDWSQLAVGCGYFDQSHLIRDFLAFCGVTPSEFQRRRNLLASAGIHTKRNHLPVVG
jgi:AraC-like DNA-binding protein